MLKPTDENSAGQPPDQPVGELIGRILEDGRAYALAELNVAKAIAAEKVEAFKMPAAAAVGALLVAHAAIVVLAVGVTLALATLIGPLLAGIVGFFLFGALAGGIGWWAVTKVKNEL